VGNFITEPFLNYGSSMLVQVLQKRVGEGGGKEKKKKKRERERERDIDTKYIQ